MVVVRQLRMAAFAVVLGLTALSATGCLFFPGKASVPGTAGVGITAVQGRVTNTSGAPLAGATVSIKGFPQTTVTGPDGNFLLPGIPRVIQTILVEKEGYLSAAITTDLSGARALAAAPQIALPTTASSLHMDSSRVPNLCGECHRLHGNTVYSLNGAPNDPCFKSGCHSGPGQNNGFDQTIYSASPHGPNWSLGGGNATLTTWPGLSSGISRGDCGNCHEPHGILGPPVMLRAGYTENGSITHVNEVCFTCHGLPGAGNTAGWPGKDVYNAAANLHANPVAVPPSTHTSYPGLAYTFAPGDCANCHNPHGQTSGDKRILRAQGNQLCISCHTDKVAAAGSSDGHDNCLMCHDPHSVTKSGNSLIVRNPADGSLNLAVPKETYRGAVLIKDSYCLSCHKTPAPSWVAQSPINPLGPADKFTNANLQSYQTTANLHQVHGQKIRGYFNEGHEGSYGVPLNAALVGDLNKVHCVQCHSPHHTSQPHYLSSRWITKTSPSGGTYNQKSGCQVVPGCHTCDWCHQPPGGPSYRCSDCSWHSSSSIHGVVY